jgi:hypothetical protein
MDNVKSSQVMGPQYGVVNKFERKHYMFLKFKMETLLKARDLWGLIGEIQKKPYEKDEVVLLSYSRKPNKALNLLIKVF